MRKLQNILVTGANGQLGFEIAKLSDTYPWLNLIFTDRSTLDITNKKSIASIFNRYRFNTVINCAAYTAVDKAETDTEMAYAINGKAVSMLASFCEIQEANLFHISTDFVFDGTTNEPYKEDAATNPLSVYGLSKLEGEKAALSYQRAYVFRTSWVYSTHGKNFVKTMLRLASEKPELRVVNDQFGSPTYAHDLAEALLKIATQTIHINEPSIYHYCNQGAITWFDFAKKILELKHSKTPIIPIGTSAFPTPARRPSYSVLNTDKIKQHFNLIIPNWQSSLAQCLKNLNP